MPAMVIKKHLCVGREKSVIAGGQMPVMETPLRRQRKERLASVKGGIERNTSA